MEKSNKLNIIFSIIINIIKLHNILIEEKRNYL